jgi:iron-sulfur cluster insertion protein
MSDQTNIASAPITVTGRAAKRIAELTTESENKGMMLRVAVSGGGCSGFSYGFSFDDEARADDLRVEMDGVTVLVDEVSLGLIAGAELDYVEEMVGASFVIQNPNATASCGCGNSFSVG